VSAFSAANQVVIGRSKHQRNRMKSLLYLSF
jgi:hypothetical protein